MEKQFSDSAMSNVIQVSTVDEVLSKAGMSGIMQVAIHINVFMLILTSHYRHGIAFFQVYSPPWKCASLTSTGFCNKHHNTTFTVDMEMFKERCHLNRSDWAYTVSHREYSIVTELDLVCDKSTTATLIATLFYIGTTFGALLCGPVGDMYGRKTIIVLGLVLALTTSVLLGYVHEIWEMYVFQFLSGVATSSCTYPTYVYISEFSPPEFRSLANNTCVLMSVCTFLLMDFLAYILQNWRKLSVFMGLIGIPSLLCFMFIPESPRWLLTKGKRSKANKVLSRINQFKGNIKICIRQRPDEEVAEEVYYTYWHLVSNWRLLRLTTSMVCVWSALPVLYYSIGAQSLNYGGNIYVNYMLATLPDIPAIILAMYLMNKIGRKKSTLLCLCGTGIFISTVALVPRTWTYRRAALLSLTAISKLCCSVAFAGIFLWTPEVFPTVLRAQAMAICATFEKIAVISVPFLCMCLQSVSFSLPFIVMGILGLFGAIAGIPLPETKNQPISDTCADISTRSRTFDHEVGLDNVDTTTV